jgi:hypothetical protein
MATKKFPSELASRGTVKVTDKLLIHNIDTGVTQYTTVDELLDALGIKGQVKFPAVQVPSAGVNTLDDYEEGTWTPAIAFGGASTGITYTTQDGTYTKIGNMVFLRAEIELLSKGTATGVATIAGLPFTVGKIAPISIYASLITFADFLEGVANVSTTTILLREISNAGTRTSLADTDFANNSLLIISCTYTV